MARTYKKTTYISSGGGKLSVEEILVRKRKQNRIKRMIGKLVQVVLFVIVALLFISWIYNKPKSALNEKYQDEFVIEKITSFNIIEKWQQKWHKYS